jgi:glycerophosphoryl diester phosphodiesterase
VPPVIRPAPSLLAAGALAIAAGLAPVAEAAAPVVHAHRGGSVIGGVPTYAEESMPAFRNAAQRLHTVLELDVKLTKDRVPVVIHDDTLDRTTTCTGRVKDRTLAELAECKGDVLGSPGNGLPTRPAPEPVPIATLAQVLAFAKADGIGVNLEIKNYPTDDDYDPSAAFANRVMDVVLESGIPARHVIVQGFLPSNLEVAERRMPGAEISALALAGTEDAALDYAAAKGWEWVSPAWPVGADFVASAHDSGVKVIPYTINTAADVRAATDAGVDGVITDDPLMALQTLDTKPPAATLSLFTRALARVKSSGRLRLRVTLDEPGEVALTAKLRGRVAGAATVAFDRAGARRVTIRLRRRARSALAGRERARIAVTATAADVARNTTKVKRSSKLR